MSSQISHHDIFNTFHPWRGYVEAGYSADFLGVVTRESFYTPLPAHHRARFVSTELPAVNEEYVEWIDLLQSVANSRGQFTMIELGAGWGRWLARAAAAIRFAGGPQYRLIGVEAEPTHYRWMHEHLRKNGVDLDRCELIRAAVSDQGGKVWFHVGRPDEWYGQAIAAPNSGELSRLWNWWLRALMTKIWPQTEAIAPVASVSLNSILRTTDLVDFIDLDIQGTELSVLQSAAEEVDKKARRMHIGTHSPEIESGLRELFGNIEWRCLHDYPMGRESQTPWGLISFQDGVQTWVNPRL